MSTRHIHANFIAQLEAAGIAHINRCIVVVEYLALLVRLGVRNRL